MNTAAARPPLLSLALVVGTLAAGLAVRKLPLGLPPAFTKHAGSILWALMIYWIVSGLRPRWTPPTSAAVAIAVTSGIELSQLFHQLQLDRFRETTIGALLLGRVFSITDLLVYAAGVIAGMMLDRLLRRHLLGRRLERRACLD